MTTKQIPQDEDRCEARDKGRPGPEGRCEKPWRFRQILNFRTGRFVRPDVDEYGTVPAGTEVRVCWFHKGAHGEVLEDRNPKGTRR